MTASGGAPGRPGHPPRRESASSFASSPSSSFPSRSPAAPGDGPGAETQPERTRLAWRRSTLTFLVTVLLAWRGAVVTGSIPWYAGAVLVTLLWAGFLVLAHRRITALAAAPAAPGRAPVLGAAGVVLAGCAVAAALLR
ncbi:DUF202 domain-containing protein [Streptomyces sp. YIM 98790]|uniref:DUF202 domain-containing protein n=1 Tax=Streptomyces sp. YIM 98790 TaxID=2689077 RepID=UPI001FB5CF35|nr:DUF202 domain-containing protein [Streptomyces sp. YIM 98790]